MGSPVTNDRDTLTSWIGADLLDVADFDFDVSEDFGVNQPLPRVLDDYPFYVSSPRGPEDILSVFGQYAREDHLAAQNIGHCSIREQVAALSIDPSLLEVESTGPRSINDCLPRSVDHKLDQTFLPLEELSSQVHNLSTTVLPAAQNRVRTGGNKATRSKTSNKQKRRPGLPENAKEQLNAWFDVHEDYPYPSKEDAIALASKTGATLKQITTWFCDKRSRNKPKGTYLPLKLTIIC